MSGGPIRSDLAHEQIEALRTEVRLLRSVVRSACDTSLVYISDRPSYFSAGDGCCREERESAPFTADETAAVIRALEER